VEVSPFLHFDFRNGETALFHTNWGDPMGNLDMMIAAQALAAEAVLVTHDRVFRRVKGVEAEGLDCRVSDSRRRRSILSFPVISKTATNC
jgi:predicted PilT family ATPase